MLDDRDRCEWVNVSSDTGSPGSHRQRAVKHLLLLFVCLQDSNLVSVQEAILCLPAAELKTLAKSLQISCLSLKKHDITDAILKHSQRRNVSNFFTCSSDATEKLVLKRLGLSF